MTKIHKENCESRNCLKKPEDCLFHCDCSEEVKKEQVMSFSNGSMYHPKEQPKDLEVMVDWKILNDAFDRVNREWLDKEFQDTIKKLLATQKAELLNTLEKEIDGMAFKDPAQAGQFAMHSSGYNQGIEEVLEVIKKLR